MADNQDEKKKSNEQTPSVIQNKAQEFTIEELAAKKNIPAWTMAAMKQAYKWGEGKMLTEADFDKLHRKLLKGPMAR